MPSGRPVYEQTPEATAAGHRYEIARLKRRTVPTTKVLHVIVDGGGVVIDTGVAGDVFIDFDCEIVKWTIISNESGSVEIDVWKTDYSGFPPTSGDSITASDQPTLAAQEKNQDDTLTGWTTTINAGDCLRFNIDSVDSITRLAVALTLMVKT